MKKRIFINIHYLEIGGAERALLGLLSSLNPDKVDIDLFVNQHTGEFMPLIPEWVNLLPEISEYTCIERPITTIVKEGHVGIALRRIWAKHKHKQYLNTLTVEQRQHDASVFQYVADAAAVLCKEKMYKTGINEIAIDIGTNAEILLNCSGKVFVTSTAAGPAFEGKGIRSGMRAAPGAINSVKISRVNGNIILGMLDDGKAENPRGLCGSGLIDAISELMKARLLKKDGYLLTREEALRQNVNINLCEHLKSDDKDGNCFILSEENNIVITQKDIRNVQLAKGAIQAGCEILLKKAGIGLNDINSIKIAGVFGKYIHVSQAMNFGLFPKYPEKLEIVGNAAGDGAAMALFEDGFIDEMEKQVKKVHHVELAGEKDFQKKFMNAMELKEWYYN